MQTATIDEQKKAMRLEATERRGRLSRETPHAGEALRRQFLAAVPLPAPGLVVSAFWPMGDEIDTRPLLTALHEKGYRCCLPVVVKRGLALKFRCWTPGMELVPGGFGVSVPPEAAGERVPDLLIVPLLAFDRRGYRLGYGAGFYDRTLAALRAAGKPSGGRPLAVGVGFAGQEVPAVPHDLSDARVDWIVTEREAFKTAGS